MKELILIRGLPGSGKTTIARFFRTLNDGTYPVYEISTDDFWDAKDIDFDPERISQACAWTEYNVMDRMEVNCPFIVVHNSFAQRWEMQPYEEMAEQFDYRVHHLIVEKRHDGESTKDMTQKHIDDIQSKFQVMLQ